MPGVARGWCALVQGDLRQNPFSAQFDLVGMFDVLEHVPEEMQALRDVREVLASRGALLLTVPAHQSLWSYFDEAAQHCRRYSRSELQRKIVESGYSVEFMTEFMTSIYPAVWANRRLAERHRKTNNAVSSRSLALQELRVVPGLNGLFRLLLQFENWWVQGGHRLPLGTSLLALARKR